MRITYKSLLLLGLVVLLIVMTGCEYDGPTAQWKMVQEETDSPQITEIVPASEAVAGVNYITINGENFTDNRENVQVYINGYNAEIVDFSSSSIKIRRPNRVGDSLSVKVDVYGAVNLGIYEQPYKISSVCETYGDFLSGTALGSLAIDTDENLYVVENTTTREIYKISPSGEKTLLGNADRAMNDGTLDNNGKLYLFANRKDIYVVETDTVGIYATVEKNVTTGAFDANGTLFTSGKKAGINIVAADLTTTQNKIYVNDEVFCLRIKNNTLYVLVQFKSPDEAHPEFSLWRHTILDAQGNLGDGELVFDWALAGGDYAESIPSSFTIDSKGGVYIASDNPSPILYYNPTSGTKDAVYKDILPSPAQKVLWGNGNYLYLVYSGGSSDNNLYRVDMGIPENRDY